MNKMDKFTHDSLVRVGQNFGTPSYVYFAEPIRDRVKLLLDAFGNRFIISYAVKSNPNTGLLRVLQDTGVGLDVSSIGEVKRGVDAGFGPMKISFSGPAKRPFEIDIAVRQGIGEFICESLDEIEQVNQVASDLGIIQNILVRINPKEVPRQFGLHMAGRPSQFGIDEEDMEDVQSFLAKLNSIKLSGFHIFSGGNSLNRDAVIKNLSIAASLFVSFSEKFDIFPEKFIFGSGFGIPYFEGDEALDIADIAAEINPMIDRLQNSERFKNTKFVLEMGRWLVGSDGYMLTSVVGNKHSRGTDICLCDAGFNNHLSAAGMMGTVLRRDWKFWNLTRTTTVADHQYLLVGPLCASFDILGAKVHLPKTLKGDVLAVGSSGAYGLTASPTRFISHPEPQEFIVEKMGCMAKILDVTESRMNYPADKTHLPS